MPRVRAPTGPVVSGWQAGDVNPPAPDLPVPEDRARAVLADREVGKVSSRRFSDEAILAGLRELSRVRAAELGVPTPVRVTIAQWDAWRDPSLLPTGVRILQRFRTWASVCAQAGLPVSERTAPSGAPPRWTDQELVVWVARFLLDAAGGGTTEQYARWARRLDGAPGLQTVINRLGGWNAAKTAVGRGTVHR